MSLYIIISSCSFVESKGATPYAWVGQWTPSRKCIYAVCHPQSCFGRFRCVNSLKAGLIYIVLEWGHHSRYTLYWLKSWPNFLPNFPSCQWSCIMFVNLMTSFQMAEIVQYLMAHPVLKDHCYAIKEVTFMSAICMVRWLCGCISRPEMTCHSLWLFILHMHATPGGCVRVVPPKASNIGDTRHYPPCKLHLICICLLLVYLRLQVLWNISRFQWSFWMMSSCQ